MKPKTLVISSLFSLLAGGTIIQCASAPVSDADQCRRVISASSDWRIGIPHVFDKGNLAGTCTIESILKTPGQPDQAAVRINGRPGSEYLIYVPKG